MHDVVTAFRAGLRSGTASTKTPGEVAGTNKKPWRQKGTGRARAGSFQSPLWRGGGVTFGPKPRDFSKKVNKKVSKLALRKASLRPILAGKQRLLEEERYLRGVLGDELQLTSLDYVLDELVEIPESRRGSKATSMLRYRISARRGGSRSRSFEHRPRGGFAGMYRRRRERRMRKQVPLTR